MTLSAKDNNRANIPLVKKIISLYFLENSFIDKGTKISSKFLGIFRIIIILFISSFTLNPDTTERKRKMTGIQLDFVLSNGATLPKRKSAGAVGYDICSNQDCEVKPFGQGVTSVSTGLQFQVTNIPCFTDPYPHVVETGYMLNLKPRSGHALKGISIEAGVLDPDYRGEIKVLLSNNSATPFVVTKGMAIAQLVVIKVELPAVREIEASRLNTTERGTGGFGSTDAKPLLAESESKTLSNKRPKIADGEAASDSPTSENAEMEPVKDQVVVSEKASVDTSTH